jgi:uncharacterized protein (DUF433 family)
MLGQGAYPLTDVARYAQLPPATARSWFKWRSDKAGRGPIFKSDLAPVGKDFAVSFLDLIDAYVARFFFNAEVKPATIRSAYRKLQADLDTPHPFAHVDLCAGDGRILRTTELVDVINKQKWFGEMKQSLTHLDYEPVSKLASRWNIAEGVVIDPRVGFGRPTVKSSGVTTYVLAKQYTANKRNAALVAELYNVQERDVLNAARFEARAA